MKNAKVAIKNENETDGGGGGGVDWNHLQRIHMAYQKMLEQNREIPFEHKNNRNVATTKMKKKYFNL